jgi:antitoxin (DNA-binding transcriptional repressor) of toxin-antitoxin stability system
MAKNSKSSVSIRELHEKTGELVRRAGKANKPLPITDHGEVVAVLASPDVVLPLRKRPKRVILPGYRKSILETPQKGDVLEDLDAVRGDR